MTTGTVRPAHGKDRMLSDSPDPERDITDTSDARQRDELAMQHADRDFADLHQAIEETWTRFIAATLSTSKVAAKLAISTSSVRRLRTSGQLVAVRNGRTYRYPAWQFTRDGRLPFLAAIIAATPDTTSPISIHGLMTTPQPALLAAGEPLTPPEWLTRGGCVDTVLALIDSLHRR